MLFDVILDMKSGAMIQVKPACDSYSNEVAWSLVQTVVTIKRNNQIML